MAVTEERQMGIVWFPVEDLEARFLDHNLEANRRNLRYSGGKVKYSQDLNRDLYR